MNKPHKLYTDGSYKSRLNFAGYGGYVLDGEENKVFEFSEIIKNPSLYRKHEILGLARGLELCIEKGIQDLVCYTDLKQLALIANTADKKVQDIYIERNPLLADVINLKSHFNSIQFFYLPRKKNFLADKLSRKAVVEFTHPQYANIEAACPNIVVGDNYSTHHNPKSLQGIEDKNFFIFYIKNNMLEVFFAQKDSESYRTILSCPTEGKKINFWATKVAEVLKQHTDLKSCVVYCYEKNNATGGDFKAVVEGAKILPKSAMAAFTHLNQVVSKFESVKYYQPTELLEKMGIFSSAKSAKPLVNTESSQNKEKIVEALTLLSQDNYQLGTHPDIENFFPNKKDRNFNVEKLQKLYFNEFLKLSVVYPFSQHEKVLPELRQQFMQEQIPILQQELRQRGIKLRY